MLRHSDFLILCLGGAKGMGKPEVFTAISLPEDFFSTEKELKKEEIKIQPISEHRIVVDWQVFRILLFSLKRKGNFRGMVMPE